MAPMGSMGELPKMPPMPDMSQLPNMPKGMLTAPGADGGVFVWSAKGSRQIGVNMTPLTKQLGDYFGVTDGNGLLISSVRENSPAAKAGLKAGDVIVEIDGKPIKGDLDIVRTLNEKKEGDVELTIVRDRNRQTVRVTPETVKGDLSPLMQNFDGQGFSAPGSAKGMLAAPGPMIWNFPGRVL